MTAILTATAVVGIIGLIIGFALVGAGKAFHVEVDERESAVRERLPGNNCGACGYAGCDAVAAAIVKGEVPVNACPVCSADAIKSIGEIMGVEAEAAERRAAFVKCSGSCDKSPYLAEYSGLRDCKAAAASMVQVRGCSYGCIGYGSCVNVCNYNAIHVINGVAAVDTSLCVGCGMCAKTCPMKLIEILPNRDTLRSVRCSNRDRGADVRKVCSAGCIGCGMCERQCEFGAVKVTNNVAHIDAEKCTGCGKCQEKCPTKVIVTMASKVPAGVGK